MKIYPDANIWFYVEKPSGMDTSTKYPRNHSWKINDKTTSRVMYYWRDIEGVKMSDITLNDLYFADWPKTRIRPQACLGLLYATGNRFIRLTMAPPAGFKCAPMPVNLAMARLIKAGKRAEKKKTKADKKNKGKGDDKDKDKGKGNDKGKGKGGNNDLKPKVIRTYADAEKA